ncbi:GDSL-type esterase/lipase family protein, partial [Mycobacterium tuberculosis]
RTPDLAIVELGANDLRRGVAPARTRANLDQILTVLASCGIATLLTTFEVPPFLKAHAASYDGLYADVATRHGADQAPFFPPGVMGNPHLTLPDGLHPNARAID